MVMVEVERQFSKVTEGNQKEEKERLERANVEKPNNQLADLLDGDVVEQRAREEV